MATVIATSLNTMSTHSAVCCYVMPSISPACVSTKQASRITRHRSVDSAFFHRFPLPHTPSKSSPAISEIRPSSRTRRTSTRACALSGLVTSSDRALSLPWTNSINGDDVDLLFMPFLEHQLHVMCSELPDVIDFPFERELSYQESRLRPARIESWMWRSDLFRKIRATYIDAGPAAQVFNSVWYPDAKYDAPLLGIDFLSFGKKKVICVLDYQPLLQTDEYLNKYCEPIDYIKRKYEGISGTMSARFYDENKFFSKQLALGKFDDSGPVKSQLFPAFKEYLRDYIAMLKREEPNPDPVAQQRVRDLHKDYDQYSAERDPAVGLFSTYWGKEWAENFTYGFLFSDATPSPSEKGEETAREAGKGGNLQSASK